MAGAPERPERAGRPSTGVREKRRLTKDGAGRLPARNPDTAPCPPRPARSKTSAGGLRMNREIKEGCGSAEGGESGGSVWKGLEKRRKGEKKEQERG